MDLCYVSCFLPTPIPLVSPPRLFAFSLSFACWMMTTATVQVQGKGVQLPFRALAVVMGLPVVM